MYFGHIKVSIGGESGRMPLVKYFHITIYWSQKRHEKYVRWSIGYISSYESLVSWWSVTSGRIDTDWAMKCGRFRAIGLLTPVAARTESYSLLPS
jgi:hypothetical protein